MDHELDLRRAARSGSSDQQRLHADVAGIAHADRGADQRDVEDQHQRQALGPGRRVVQHVAAEHLVEDDRDDDEQAGDREVHAVARDGALNRVSGPSVGAPSTARR